MNKKYLAAAALVSGMSILPLANSASATTVSNGTATVPVVLTSVAATPINITIGSKKDGSDDITADKLYMKLATADSNTATVSPLVVTNNSVASPIYVTGITMETRAGTGYEVVEYTPNNFKDYDVDSKKVAFRYNGTDLSTGWTGTSVVAAASNVPYEFDGLATLSSTGISTETNVANCVVTVSQTAPSVQ